MSVKLLSEHHLEFVSLKWSWTSSSESTLVKMPHCWKSHVMAHVLCVIWWVYSVNALILGIPKKLSCHSFIFIYLQPLKMFFILTTHNMIIIILTHISLASFLWDIRKQYTTQWRLRRVVSDLGLHCFLTRCSNKIWIKMIYKTIKMEKDWFNW